MDTDDDDSKAGLEEENVEMSVVLKEEMIGQLDGRVDDKEDEKEGEESRSESY